MYSTNMNGMIRNVIFASVVRPTVFSAAALSTTDHPSKKADSVWQINNQPTLPQPGTSSSLGLPATITRSGLQGYLNCQRLPFVLIDCNRATTQLLPSPAQIQLILLLVSQHQ